MTAFERMRLREQATGATPREEMIYNARSQVNDLIADDPSYKIGVSIMRNGESVGEINLRMDNRRIKNNAPTMDLHDILDNDIVFRLGDVFHTVNDGKEEYWLCTDANPLHSIQLSGECEECNFLLRWQNPNTFEIVYRWCSVRDPYTSGTDEGKVVSTGGGKYRIKLPHDSETELLRLDRRFLIDISNNEPVPYKLTKFDATSNRYASRDEGFLVILVDQTELIMQDNGDGVDRGDLMVANWKPEPEIIPPIGSCHIELNGNTVSNAQLVVSSTQTRTFVVKYFDNDGNELFDVTTNWIIEHHPDFTDLNLANVIRVSENDSQIVLRGQGGAPRRFILRAEGSNGVYDFKASVIIELRPLF
jgi:hypothetical protein